MGNFHSINLAKAKLDPSKNLKKPEDVRLGFYISQDLGVTWKQYYLKFVHNGAVKYTDTHRFLSDVKGPESEAVINGQYSITNKHYSIGTDDAGWYEIVDRR